MDVGLDDRTLRRIIAILVSLAALAERAADRSFPLRWFLLAILRHAEAVAFAFVVETTQSDWPGFEEPLEPGSRPVDAVLLAWRLRMLAAVLGALLAPADYVHGPNARIVRPLRRFAPRPGRHAIAPGGWSTSPHDTS